MEAAPSDAHRSATAVSLVSPTNTPPCARHGTDGGEIPHVQGKSYQGAESVPSVIAGTRTLVSKGG